MWQVNKSSFYVCMDEVNIRYLPQLFSSGWLSECFQLSLLPLGWHAFLHSFRIVGKNSFDIVLFTCALPNSARHAFSQSSWSVVVYLRWVMSVNRSMQHGKLSSTPSGLPFLTCKLANFQRDLPLNYTKYLCWSPIPSHFKSRNCLRFILHTKASLQAVQVKN